MKDKLLAIQNELKAPKGQYNAFGKYKYRSCEDILESVKPLLLQYKCLLTMSDKIILVGDRFYVEATVLLQDVESDKSLSVTAYAREEENKKGMDGSQITGSSSSYARKYALNGMFNIDDTKDSDATNKHDEKAQEKIPAPQEKKPESNIDIYEVGAQKCKTLDELKSWYTKLSKADKSKAIAAKDKRKKELESKSLTVEDMIKNINKDSSDIQFKTIDDLLSSQKFDNKGSLIASFQKQLDEYNFNYEIQSLPF